MSMKKLLILSGKGGTGKTTLASAFIELGKISAFADCDVDAPNLHLVMNQKTLPETFDFYGMPKAFIDPSKCMACGLCQRHCRFGAVFKNGVYGIDPHACEGCGVCEKICNASAISMTEVVSGTLKRYEDEHIFATATLKMGHGASGLLVTEVKKQLERSKQVHSLAIIDGSPGIGCPVIASINGIDRVLIVAEPSCSGISDLKRILATTKKLGVGVLVCINKYDTNTKQTNDIELLCEAEGILCVGKIPFDQEVVRLVNQGRTIVSGPSKVGQMVKAVFDQVMTIMSEV